VPLQASNDRCNGLARNGRPETGCGRHGQLGTTYVLPNVVGRCGFGRWRGGRALSVSAGSVGLEGSGVTFDELIKSADGELR
jgi:hypothetical protein